MVTLQQSNTLTRSNMTYKSLVQVIKEHNADVDLEEAFRPNPELRDVKKLDKC